MKNAIVLLVVWSGWACTLFSRDLNRGRAQELLEADSTFATPFTQVELAPDRLTGGEREGLWTGTPTGRFQLTPEGHVHFATMEVRTTLFSPRAVVGFNAPVRRRIVQITGIREIDKTQRAAEFTWRFEGPDDVGLRYLGSPPGAQFKGSANFQKYDEGWRVSDVATPFTAAPFVMDAAAAQSANKLAGERAVAGLEGNWGGVRKHFMNESQATLELFRQGSGVVGRGTYGPGCSSTLELIRTELDRLTFAETFSVSSGCGPHSTSASVTVRPGDSQTLIQAIWEGGDLGGANGILNRLADAPARAEVPSLQALGKEAIDAEQARQERMHTATTATRVVGRYRFARGPRELVISDVGLTITYYDYSQDGKPLEKNYGFWHVKDVELGADQEDRGRRPEVKVWLESTLGAEAMNPKITGGGLEGSTTAEEVLAQLKTAMEAWKQKYPDRSTWIPVSLAR